MPSPNDPGPIWGPASLHLDDLVAASGDAAASFDAAMRAGCFSQYTAYEDAAFLGAVVDWQLARFSRQNFHLDEQPIVIAESQSLPDRLCLERFGRRVSADFLRNLGYIRYLKVAGFLDRPASKILEIGGGFGAFARLLKLYRRDATIFLVDLWSSLRFADHFLRQSFPDGKILTVRPGEPFDATTALAEVCPYDFVLVPIESADTIVGAEFSLAVNIWSFGEMPDIFLKRWFDLIQRRNTVRSLLSLNAFLHPVRTGLPHLMALGNWLPQLDADWSIDTLEADPEIHRCPFILNFPTGLLLIAHRIVDDSVRNSEANKIGDAFQLVLKCDWVRVALGGTGSDGSFEADELSCERLIEESRYIGIFSLSRIADGTFAALWNQHRLNGSILAARLIVVYCRLICRFDNYSRATREELFYLRQSGETKLAQNYSAFFGPQPMEGPCVVHADRCFGIQEASALASVARSHFQNDEAEALLMKVVAVMPQHAESWFQLGQLAEDEGMQARALLYYTLADELYVGWGVYRTARIRAAKECAHAFSELAQNDTLGVVNDAVALIEQGNLDGAEANLCLIAADHDLVFFRAQALSLLAKIADRQGDYLRYLAYRAFVDCGGQST